MAIMINHRITENPIKPGDYFLILDPHPALQSARKGRLEDIFGNRSRFDSPFEECQKFAVSAH